MSHGFSSKARLLFPNSNEIYFSFSLFLWYRCFDAQITCLDFTAFIAKEWPIIQEFQVINLGFSLLCVIY